MSYSFFRKCKRITILLLICNSFTRWSTKFVSLKLCVRISIFDSVSFLLKFIFFYSTKCMDSLTVKRQNSFQSQNNRKVTHSFVPRPLIFKLQQESFKIQWYLRGLELPKNWPANKVFKLRKSKFSERQFFSIATLK